MAGNLFVLPRQVPIVSGVVSPGAKATFTQTGTTTPQNTYTDIALTTPSSNPVVADADGVFAPIYFDPSFGDYRLKLTDSADVLIYQDDDIPASQSGQTLTLTAANPFIDLIESDAAANNGVWRIGVNGEQLTIQVGNDALSSFTDVLTIDRTANTVDTIDLLPTTLLHNTLPLGTITSTFVATWLGFTTSPTTTYTYTKVGNIVTVRAGANLSATSNTTTLTAAVATIPVAIRPAANTNGWARVTDNGTTTAGVISFNSDGSIGFSPQAAATLFTASGTKGFIGLSSFTYGLD